MSKLPETVRDTILQVLKKFPEILTAIVFGSAVTGRMQRESDVDIAVAGAAPLDISRTAELATALEQALGRPVDLVDLKRNSGIIFMEVFDKGEVILKRSTEEYAGLLRKLWFFREDELPNIRYILRRQVERFVHEK